MKKTMVAVIAAMCILISGMAAYMPNASENLRVPVLLYHNVVGNYDVTDPNERLVSITPAAFEEHIKAMTDAGFMGISFDEYYQHLEGKLTLPDKPVIITFDDGYTSNYEKAFPILQKYNMKATIFVVTGRVGDTTTGFPHFTWEEARQMQHSGLVRIYSHTNTHRDMNTLSRAESNTELRLSKYLIETKLGTPCDVLAYPYGSYSGELEQAAYDMGYKLVCEVSDTAINNTAEGPEPIKRLTVWGSFTAKEILQLIK